MAKIPFDVKYRPQIESGEYKVETRSGKTARIVCWDRIGTPFVVLVGRGEEVLTYKSNGTTGQQMQLPSDLFIVTPEEELTPFEDRLAEIIVSSQGLCTFDACKSEAKKSASELLALARRELHENMKEALRTEYEKGRADALKDLPRWGNNDFPEFNDRIIESIDHRTHYLLHNGKKIRIEDLEKLPGFKEEER